MLLEEEWQARPVPDEVWTFDVIYAYLRRLPPTLTSSHAPGVKVVSVIAKAAVTRRYPPEMAGCLRKHESPTV